MPHIKARIGGKGMSALSGIDVQHIVPNTLWYTNDYLYFIAEVNVDALKHLDSKMVEVITKSEYISIYDRIKF